jgi:hypothetical protein
MTQTVRSCSFPIHSNTHMVLTHIQVIIRKMTRDQYLRKYAKDAEGNYVGMERAAPDAGLVFVAGKSSSEELLRQVHKVAFGREHAQEAFLNGLAAGQGW